MFAPGFVADCLETLEEVAQMLKDDFRARGGELRYIACLNDSPAHARVLAAIARDAAGNKSTATGVTVTVSNVAPTVSLSEPGCALPVQPRVTWTTS